MGDFIFNVARGRAHEIHRIIDGNVIAASALKLVVLTSTGGGLEDDEILRDYDNLGALLAASNNEPTNSGYARKTLDDTVLTAPVIDDANDQVTRLTQRRHGRQWQPVIRGPRSSLVWTMTPLQAPILTSSPSSLMIC